MTVINQGNLIGLMGSFQTEDGKIHELADIWFKTEMLKTTPISSEVNPSALLDIVSASELAFAEIIVESKPELMVDDLSVSNPSNNVAMNSVDVHFESIDSMTSYDVHISDSSKPILHDQIRPLI
jgi:hypothetical protein